MMRPSNVSHNNNSSSSSYHHFYSHGAIAQTNSAHSNPFSIPNQGNRHYGECVAPFPSPAITPRGYQDFNVSDASTRFKTRLCRQYLATGHCPYEQKCMFAHGPDDLRTPEMNLRDGITCDAAIRRFRKYMEHQALARQVEEQQRQVQLQRTFAGSTLKVPHGSSAGDSSNSHDSVLPFIGTPTSGDVGSVDEYASESSAYGSIPQTWPGEITMLGAHASTQSTPTRRSEIVPTPTPDPAAESHGRGQWRHNPYGFDAVPHVLYAPRLGLPSSVFTVSEER